MAFAPPAVDDIEEASQFTPPAPDDIEQPKPGTNEYDKFKLQEAAAASAGLPLESYQASVPPSLNPDYDFTRATGGNPTLKIMGAAAKGVSHAVALAAVPVISQLKQAMGLENAGMNKGVADVTPAQEGKPELNLPRLTPAEMEGATPGERALAGVGEGLAGAYESFTTPENIALLPLAEAKPVQAMFTTQMAASIPESLQAVANAKTPDEKAKAITSLGLNVALTSTLTHSMMKEGVPNASKVASPTGLPVPEIRQQVGQEAPLRQQGEATPARATEAAPSEVSLRGEYHDLLEPHWDDDHHSFGTLGDNQVMMADHASGKVIVDPEQFQAFVDNDLKGLSPKEKAAAVQAMFDEENIHLKTEPEDADAYEQTLSPFEKRIFTRNYMRGSTEPLSPRNLGFEVIRKRVQQASGMTPSEFIGLTLRERWTAKSLDALAETVAKIRRLKDKELNANQKAILDKVMANIGAAKNALPAQQVNQEDESQYVEGPFSRRTADQPEEGKTRLYRGHDGGEGGAYWTTDKTYASRMGSKMESVDVPTDQLGDHAVRATEGSGTPNAFKLPTDLTKDSKPVETQVPVHDLDVKADELLKNKPGETTAEEVMNLSDAETRKFFEGNQKRGNATQHDAVLAGMKLGVDKIPELTKMRDEMHQTAMRKMQAGVDSGKLEMPAEFGKVIWLNGALEGAARKGPNYESVTARRRAAEGPNSRRRADKGDINQDKLFGAPMTKKGIPGEEPTPEGHAAAAAVGAREVPSEQKVFPKEMTFDFKQYGAKSLPFREVTASEAKNPAELTRFLTADARKGGSALPVSMSKRLTVLFDKTDGTVHMVSTYQGDGIARMVDPEKAGMERNSRPIDELLHRYQPIASVLLAEPRQGFHQKFMSMDDFRKNFSDEAKDLMREHGTGFTGIPMTEVSRGSAVQPEYDLPGERYAKASAGGARLQQGATPFRYPSEKEPNLPRPTTEELKAFHDFFGDVAPSDANMFNRRIERQAATASRTMINGLRKLVRIERAQTRGLSEGEAIGRVIDRLYENYQGSETRSEFVARTTAQNDFGAPKEIPPGGAPRETGARELSTRRDVAPTTVRGMQGPRPQTPEPANEPVKPVEKLSAEDQAALDAELRKEHPTDFSTLKRTLGRQLVERPVPKEKYTVAGSKSIQDQEVPDDPQAGKEESAADKQKYIEMLKGWLKSQEARTAPDKLVKEAKEALADALDDYEETQGQPYEDIPDAQQEFFPSREVESHFPEEAEAPTESLAAMKKVVAKGEGNVPQLDFWKKQGPASRRRADETFKKFKDYLEKTSSRVKVAGNVSDELYRLKSSEGADISLARPVVKAWMKLVPESNRTRMLAHTDEMQVLGKSNVVLMGEEKALYETFLKPLVEQNRQIYQMLTKRGVDVGDSTYLTRTVQDPHSLYSRLLRGVKQRVAEGQLLGQYASFFRRRVFKALEDADGNRRMVAMVGTGDRTKVIAYSKGKAELMGDMPHSSIKTESLTTAQRRSQKFVDTARMVEMHQLNREQVRLDKMLEDVSNRPDGPGKEDAVKDVQDQVDALQAKYVDLEDKYPIPLEETPRYWRDKKGVQWKVTDATVGEIESNTNTRFYHEPMAALIAQNLKLKQIYRAHQFLEELKNSEQFKSVSHAGLGAPGDWRIVDAHVFPQLRGLRIEPHLADELDMFAEETKGPGGAMKVAGKVNSLLREAVFIANPFVHEPNLIMHWYTARGIEWVNPAGYARGLRSAAQSLHDVMTHSQFRDQAMRAGAPLKVSMKGMTQDMLKLMSHELSKDKTLGQRVAQMAGQVNPLRFIRKFGDTMTWGTNEILTLQLIRETMQRTGLPLEQAIAEVGKHMPTYRVPARVLNSTFISKVMRSPVLSLWGRYRYGALKSYGEIGKEIFSPKSTAKERLEGVGRAGAIVFAMAVMYPVIDDIINKVMKTKGLKMRRAGSTTIPQSILEAVQRKRTPESVLESTLSPSPVWTGPLELAYNRNLRTGMPVYERRLSGQAVKDVGSFALSKLAPVEQADSILTGHKSLKDLGLGLAGFSRTRADTAISQFGRLTDDWMRKSPNPMIQEQYKRRTQDVFPESDYQLLRSAVIRDDYRAGQMAMDSLLKTRTAALAAKEPGKKPEAIKLEAGTEVLQRINAWQHTPFTGEKQTELDLMKEMTPEDWDLWFQAKREKMDIANQMKNHLVDAVMKEKP